MTSFTELRVPEPFRLRTSAGLLVGACTWCGGQVVRTPVFEVEAVEHRCLQCGRAPGPPPRPGPLVEPTATPVRRDE
ncbi:MAG: hypothetical protein OXE02_08300 [Chloroflexi bacterium]|nr:hypothetical protein [Chloroflexota bacterium]